jgi:hypothetical protein
MRDSILKIVSVWFLRRHFYMHILFRHKYYIHKFTSIFVKDGGHHIWRVMPLRRKEVRFETSKLHGAQSNYRNEGS